MRMCIKQKMSMKLLKLKKFIFLKKILPKNAFHHLGIEILL